MSNEVITIEVNGHFERITIRRGAEVKPPGFNIAPVVITVHKPGQSLAELLKGMLGDGSTGIRAG